jgi:hypothetical protein
MQSRLTSRSGMHAASKAFERMHTTLNYKAKIKVPDVVHAEPSQNSAAFYPARALHTVLRDVITRRNRSYRMRSTSITKVQVIMWCRPASVSIPLRLVTVIATLSLSSSGTTVRLFESRDDRRGGGSLDMMIQGGFVGSTVDCDKYS